MMVDFRHGLDDQITQEARELREQLRAAARALELFTSELDSVTHELVDEMHSERDDNDQ